VINMTYRHLGHLPMNFVVLLVCYQSSLVDYSMHIELLYYIPTIV